MLEISNSLQTLGLCFGGIINDEWVCDGDPELIALAKAAHDQPLASTECIALRDYLGGETDVRWLAYVEARKQPMRDQRQQRYAAETDPMLSKAFELAEGAENVELDGGKSVRVPASDKMAAWEAAKNAIRAELPYP